VCWNLIDDLDPIVRFHAVGRERALIHAHAIGVIYLRLDVLQPRRPKALPPLQDAAPQRDARACTHAGVDSRRGESSKNESRHSQEGPYLFKLPACSNSVM
jgi:hypothetical protein